MEKEKSNTDDKGFSVSVYLSKDLNKKIKDEADDCETSASSVIRRVLKKYFKKKEKKNV